MRPKRIIYYSDPLNDDFASMHIRTREIGAGFPFVRNSRFWRIAAFLLYYLVAIPIVFVISKIYLGLRFENRGVLRQLHRTGYFLYGNHTRALDAFLPAMTVFPKRAYVISNPDAASLPGLQRLVLMLGVIPIPTCFSGMGAFLSALSRRCREGGCVAIFPEAHIWPFYTGIRPFSDTSFRYPVQEQLPAVAMVATYRRRRGLFRFARRPGMTVTLSQPMYPRTDLSPKKAREDLRNRVYQFMLDTAASKENIDYIRYESSKDVQQ